MAIKMKPMTKDIQSFYHGVLHAVLVLSLHDQPTIAAEIVNEADADEFLAVVAHDECEGMIDLKGMGLKILKRHRDCVML